MNNITALLLVFISFNMAAQIVDIPVNFESDPVINNNGADDPSLWAHPTDPDKSFFLGADKKLGTGQLNVFDLLGSRIGTAATGNAINNVDVRYNFPFNGERIDIVTACNVSDKTIEIWRINPSDRTLTSINGNNLTGLSTLYGYKMYHNACTDKFYGFVSQKNAGTGGTVYQYELFDNSNGGVDINLVRTINNIPTLVEGITADDVLGHLYIGEEDVAVWKYGANPEDDLSRVKMDSVSGPNLNPDIEGLTIYYSNDSTGYLIASSQNSSNSFAVYEREEDNKYLGSFRLVFGGVDGVENCDGVEVMSYPMGGYFDTGALIAHDYSNTSPNAYSNYKMVPWEDIANAMGLRIDTSYSPREMSPPMPRVITPDDTICTNWNETAILSIDESKFTLVKWSTNATTKSIVVDQPGTYYATVFNECQMQLQTDTIEIYGKLCLTNIDEHGIQSKWQISPNPATQFIKIKHQLSNNAEIEVFDITGKKVLVFVLNNSTKQIDISSLEKGTYLVKLWSDEKLLDTKMIIKSAN
jgi:3-phytase